MSSSFIEDIQEVFKDKTTEELLSVYKKNNRNEWSDDTFDAIKNILNDRSIPIPEQNVFVIKQSDEIGENGIALPTKRFVNYFIDSIVMMVISYLTIMATYKIDASAFFMPISYFLYYFLFESFSGKTIGKMITNTKVIKTDGSIPEMLDIGLRTLCRMIPFEPVLMRKNYTWLHDSLSGTMVVSGNIEYQSVVCLNCRAELELTQKEMLKMSYICPLCGCKIKNSEIFKPLVKCKHCKKILELNEEEIRDKNFTCPNCKHYNVKFKIFFDK